MTQDQALQILKTGANVFLTGEPGSGKTHTLRTYIEYVRSHGLEPSITASTGIAATHIHGLTIHSWSGIGTKRFLTEYDIDRIASTEHVAKRIAKASILIIDEVSMLSGAMLSGISKVCKAIRGTPEPFGGLQVILVGDFFQLPPIMERGEKDDFAFDSAEWKNAQFLTCYLSEQHRQDDAMLLEILSAIRSASVDELHWEELRKRYVVSTVTLEKETKLYTHNVKVDELNQKEIEKLSGKKHVFSMTKKGKASLVEGLVRGCLSPETLFLKLNARVMCTKNNVQRGFVNGTLGTVVGFGEFNGYPIIKTEDESEILVEPMSWQVEDEGKVKAEITQVPLRLAWAITVHKSQGMSLDSATIDLSKAFTYGQGYVALSRVRTLSGITLVGMNQSALLVHPDILEKDRRFKSDSYEAELMFERIPEKEMVALHTQFILANGGTIEKGAKSKGKKLTTQDATLALFKQGLNLEDIARERKIKVTTIIDHIYVLLERGDVNRNEVLQLADTRLSKSLPAIYAAFKEIGDEKLAPIFEYFNGTYMYDDLRLARVLYNARD